MFANSLGTSESTHLNAACKTAKIYIGEKIQGTHTEAVEFLRKIDENPFADGDEHEETETPFDSVEICDLDTDIGNWIHIIDEEAKETVLSSDDGDRDNILENKAFAKLFIRLCKMLPLFSAISNKFFDSPNFIGSSWSSETYFKNLKQLHGDGIPCNADVFIKRDLQLSNSSVIKASQKFFSIQSEHLDFSDDDAPPIARNVSQSDDSGDDSADKCTSHTQTAVDELVSSTSNIQNAATKPVTRAPVSITSKAQNTSSSTDHDRIKCPACSNGDSPAGAHKCIVCDKAVHPFDGCSVSIGDEEGYGEQRKCIACHQAESVETRCKKKQVIDAKDMNHEEKWNRSSKSNSSKYTQPVKNWNLIAINKKVKIGCLVNENLKQTVYKNGPNKFKLSNTCAVDAVIQLIATAIAYNTEYRKSVRNENDGIFEIAKALAAKYDFYYIFLYMV